MFLAGDHRNCSGAPVRDSYIFGCRPARDTTPKGNPGRFFAAFLPASPDLLCPAHFGLATVSHITS